MIPLQEHIETISDEADRSCEVTSPESVSRDCWAMRALDWIASLVSAIRVVSERSESSTRDLMP